MWNLCIMALSVCWMNCAYPWTWLCTIPARAQRSLSELQSHPVSLEPYETCESCAMLTPLANSAYKSEMKNTENNQILKWINLQVRSLDWGKMWVTTKKIHRFIWDCFYTRNVRKQWKKERKRRAAFQLKCLFMESSRYRGLEAGKEVWVKQRKSSQYKK